MRIRQNQEVLHYPRLDTVMMVEDAIKKAKAYPTRMKLWRSLPRQVQYQTFQLILGYLQKSNKVFITREGKLMWVFTETSAARKLITESVATVRSKLVKRSKKHQ